MADTMLPRWMIHAVRFRAGSPGGTRWLPGRFVRPNQEGRLRLRRVAELSIRAMGTLGAATYLTSNIEELYAVVRTRRWSTLIESRYDPDTRVIQSVDRITDIY